MAEIRLQQQYGRWAPNYDRETHSFQWSAPAKLETAALRHCPAKRGLRVIDLGVGTGLASLRYLRGGAQVIGLDLAPEMLTQAKARRPAYADLIRHDINQPLETAGIRPESVDLILSSGTLHFAADLAFTLKECAHALAPGGVLAFTYIPRQDRAFGPDTRLHTPEEVEGVLAQLGLALAQPQEPFVAYLDKGNPKDPVIYRSVVATKRETTRA